MQVTLSIASDDSGPGSDFTITAPAGTTVQQLRPVLRAHLGCSPAAPLASAGQPLPDSALLGERGLRSGCQWRLGAAGARAAELTAVLQLRIIAGPNCGQILPLQRGDHLIGRDESADIEVADPDVSRQHAQLQVAPHAISIKDLGSTNGTWVGEHRVGDDAQPVELGSAIRLGNSELVVLAPDEPPAVTRADGTGSVLVHRPPRIRALAEPAVVEFPAAAEPTRKPRLQWVTATLPAVLAAGLALATGSVQFLAFALLSPVTMLAGAVSDRQQWRRGTRTSRTANASAERAAQLQLEGLMADEQRTRRRQYPDAAAILHAASVPDCRLWERRRRDPDFLHLRLGLADLPAQLTISRAGAGQGHPTVWGVPATVELARGPLGLAGPPGLAEATARWLIGQLLTLHSPTEVTVIALLDGADPNWRWLRWPRPAVVTIADRPNDQRRVIDELTRLMHQRRTARPSTGWPGPWTVILIDPADSVAKVPGLPTLLEDGPAVGITAICVGGDPRVLPPSCRTTAVVVSEVGARLAIRAIGEPDRQSVADGVSVEWGDRLGRALAPLRDADADATSRLPDEVSLTDLLDLTACTEQAIRQRWSAGRDRGGTPIGMGAQHPFGLDLVRDGPHLLIAGTTGSGKSELLRSLVVGLAASARPDEVAFVLIDYKGGAAFAECTSLPHTLGVVTDLDRHLTQRALVSLEAELRGREAAFAHAGVPDLVGFRAIAGARHRLLPRLVLVIDEFASLAEELPEFMTGLLGIAQRGRSLGVHLILATQRPAGVVSADIKANMSLRIALRVTDPAESIDVIGDDSAARIARSLPGRAFARLAGGELVEFQTARVGVPTVAGAAISVHPLDDWNRPAPEPTAVDATNGLVELSAAIAGVAAADQVPIPPPPWLPALPALVAAGALADQIADRFQVPIGLTDDPTNQRQQPELLDLAAGGSLGIIGGPRSGRTSALRSVLGLAVSRLSCDELHLYVIDCAGRSFSGYQRLPHCGAVVDREAPDSVCRLISRLADELSERRRQLATLGAASVAEARQLGHPIAVMLLAVDGWEGLSSVSEEFDAGRSADQLIQVLRDGPAAGLTVLVTGDRAALGVRLGSALGRRLVLALTDRADYTLAGINPATLPASLPAGRAVLAETGLQLQLALLDNDCAANAQDRAVFDQALGTPPSQGGPAIRLRPIPELVTYAELVAAGPAPEDQHCLLGIGGDNAEPVHADLLSEHCRFLIAGPARSGRSSAASLIARQAIAAGRRVLFAGPARSPLLRWARSGLDLIIEPDGDLAAVRRLRASDFDIVMIDDVEQFADTPAGDFLLELAQQHPAPVLGTARTDDLLVSFRGLGVELRRHRRGLLLQPRPSDGELLGVRLGALGRAQPVGRGLLITDHTDPAGVAVQLAR